MSAERWPQVKALFEATLERPPAERTAFLAAATGGDEALRREIESLLASDGSAGGFTNRLPGRDALRVTDCSSTASPSGGANDSEKRFTTNENVGPYRIVGLLGAGGMGEVFRARDSKLNRDVALKVLPGAFELDPDRLARFRREAQALAALNHPHIGAIYGLEESNGRQALVLELVEGVTLASRIADGPLPLVEALTIARQLAEALQAAHDKGIIHRDLKPANVKVTPAGIVKVLDFGLAKAAADAEPIEASDAPTLPGDTRVGVIVGTAAYMSPEQARGEQVDAGTDIWAFGCVLFEMLSGARAFAADAASDSIARVLEGEPGWHRVPKRTPASVQQLLRRCLQKDPGHRPQTIAEARTIIEQVLAPRTSRRTWAAVAAAATIATAVGVYGWLRDRPTIANRPDWVQLTSLDSVTQPALSPDGRMLAFIRGASTFVGPGQLYVKQLPDGEPVALTNDNLPKMSPVFSPDGSRIAYTVNDGSSWDTWEVPTLRGEARRWQPNASGLTWIGTNDLLFAEIKTGSHMAIVRSRESREESRDLYLPPHVGGMAHRAYASPDRSRVLVVEMDELSVWLPCRLVSIDGGASQVVGPAKARCTDAAWSPDGRWMYFTADAGDGFHIWRQRVPDGLPEQVTSGPTEEEGLAIAEDGKSLITSVGIAQRSVWLHDPSGERQISLEGYAFWPQFSADGRKVSFRVTSGVATGSTPSELWLADVGSGQIQRLFPGQLVTGYDVSRNDRIVASVMEQDGRARLWLAWIDGREPPRRLGETGGANNPRFGNDGWILYFQSQRESGALYRIRENGADRERVAMVGGNVIGGVSPDGEWLTGIGTDNEKILLYSTSGRPPIPLLPRTQTSRLRWSPDGKHAYLAIQYGQASAWGVGRTYVLPLAPGSVLPHIPPGGFRTEAEVAAVSGVHVIPHADVAPGPSPSVYAFSRVTTTRNLYRIPLQ